jgi:DNA-directed RNA polymerase subunit RPC12/RpoP
VVLRVDELEALRLADKEGMYQEQAAEQMKISRPTFGRIVETARRKVAEALVEGKALRIEGGNFVMAEMRTFQCSDCSHTWQVPFGTGRPAECPDCHSRDFCRADKGRGRGCRHHGAGYQPGRAHRHGGRRGESPATQLIS